MISMVRRLYLQLTEHGPDSMSSWFLYLLLWPFSCIFEAIVWLRRAAYRFGLCRQYRASVPVVSVGNLTTGGTGKTPVVDALRKYLSTRGRRVAVISV